MEHSLGAQIVWSRSFITRFWRALLSYLLLEIISVASGLLFVWMSKLAIDHAIVADTTRTLWQDLFWVAFFLLLSFLSTLLGSWINERCKARMLVDLQNDIVDLQMRADWQRTAGWHTGELMIRAISDSQEVVNVLGSLWVNIVSTFLRFAAAWAMLYYLDSILAGVLLLAVPLIFLSKAYMRKLKKLNKKLKNEEGVLGAEIQENLGNRLFIRSIGWVSERLESLFLRQDSIYRKKISLLGFSTLSKGMLGMVLNISYLIVFTFGVLKLQSSEISFGTMSAFLQLVSRIQGPAVSLISQIPILIRFRTALDRVMDTLSVEVEESMEVNKMHEVDALHVRGLSFDYDGTRILENINLEFRKGEVSAIVGQSGKGKSTLVRIMMGLYPIQEGEVSLDFNGQNIKMDISYRGNFSYVPQGQKLLSGSIYYNLLGERSSYSEEKLSNALQLACAEFVYSLPQGLQTIIGESGYGLSEGQAQRIGIARAILQDRPIWIFDEVTSALDQSTSEKLLQNIIRISEHKIIVIITHDLSFAYLFKQINRVD